MDSTYVIRARLGRVSFGEAVDRVSDALREQGFGILTEIDIARTLDVKLGVEFRPYCILGACNPVLAHRALELEPEIGVLLPCNVVVQEIDGEVEVLIADPAAMFGLVRSEALSPIARQADMKLRRAAASLEMPAQGAER